MKPHNLLFCKATGGRGQTTFFLRAQIDLAPASINTEAGAVQSQAQFLSPLEVASFDRDAAAAYGRIRATLEQKGTPIGSMDLLIAAHALSLGVRLVTNNAREFRRVPGLRVENWV